MNFNLEPDHSAERIKRLKESEVWREWCKNNWIHRDSYLINKGDWLIELSTCKILCAESVLDEPEEAIWVQEFDGYFRGAKTNDLILLPLEHQHRAILRELGYEVEIKLSFALQLIGGETKLSGYFYTLFNKDEDDNLKRFKT